jgi:hypothetical protein
MRGKRRIGMALTPVFRRATPRPSRKALVEPVERLPLPNMQLTLTAVCFARLAAISACRHTLFAHGAISGDARTHSARSLPTIIPRSDEITRNIC